MISAIIIMWDGHIMIFIGGRHRCHCCGMLPTFLAKMLNICCWFTEAMISFSLLSVHLPEFYSLLDWVMSRDCWDVWLGDSGLVPLWAPCLWLLAWAQSLLQFGPLGLGTKATWSWPHLLFSGPLLSWQWPTWLLEVAPFSVEGVAALEDFSALLVYDSARRCWEGVTCQFLQRSHLHCCCMTQPSPSWGLTQAGSSWLSILGTPSYLPLCWSLLSLNHGPQVSCQMVSTHVVVSQLQSLQEDSHMSSSN